MGQPVLPLSFTLLQKRLQGHLRPLHRGFEFGTKRHERSEAGIQLRNDASSESLGGES